MNQKEIDALKPRIDTIRQLVGPMNNPDDYYEAVSIAQSVMHDTVGSSHPVTFALKNALAGRDYTKAAGAARAVVSLFDHGALSSPRLAIAGEIETDILITAQSQAQAAEKNPDKDSKTIQIAIAAFLAGSALEDALRRLCDASQIEYDANNSSIARLQSVLYQPSNGIEVIGRSDTKKITVWGDTRNKADHGKFHELSITEVAAMIMGVQSFIDRYLV